MRLGESRSVELLDLHGRERLTSHQSADFAIEMASVGEPNLPRIQALLPTSDCRVRAKAMLKKQERSTNTQHSIKFTQSKFDLPDAT